MATTNLILKSFGNIRLGSGNGTPDHNSLIGSLYHNQDSDSLWQNIDGGVIWVPMNKTIYGEIGINTNTTVTAIATINVWVTLSALTWNTFGAVTLKGFTKNGNKLVLNNGLNGRYRIISSTTVLRSVSGEFEVGISKNSGTPSIGMISSAGVNTSNTSGNCVIINDINLIGGDSIELSTRCISAASNLIIRNSSIIIYRISD